MLREILFGKCGPVGDFGIYFKGLLTYNFRGFPKETLVKDLIIDLALIEGKTYK